MRSRRHHHPDDRRTTRRIRANGRGRAELAPAWLVAQSAAAVQASIGFRPTPEDYGFYNHMPATAAKALLNDDQVWRSYFKFTFERNPWDRQVSAYHFRYRRTDNAAAVRELHASRETARLDQQLRDLFDRRRGRASISSAGSRACERDLQQGAETDRARF